MRISVERGEFLKAWQIAQKYTPAKTTMEALNGIRVRASDEGIVLEATDLKSSVKYPVGGEVIEVGEVVLNAGIFGGILKKADVGNVLLETTETRGSVTTATSKMRFTTMPLESFPKLPESSNAEPVCELNASDLVRLVQEGGSASSNPSDFPKYMGTILLRTLDAKLMGIATDGRRLSYSEQMCDVQMEQDLMLSALELKSLVKDLTGNGEVELKSDGSLVWFIVDGAEYALRLIDAVFPKYERILNDNVATQMRVKRMPLIDALERVAVIATNRPDRLIAMILQGGLRLRSRAAGIGTAQELVEGATIEGAELIVGFNVNLLLSGLRAVSTDEVLIEFSGENEQARIYNVDSREFMYMLMPMRVSAVDLSDDIGDTEVVAEVDEALNEE